VDANLYNRIANACLFVAVWSALAYRPEGKWNWLVMTIGIFAGISATLLYFYNLWK
jgi:hypothetical protein